MTFQEERQYAIDYVFNLNKEMIEEWAKEAGVNTPIGFGINFYKHKMYIYTNRPGFLIGKAGVIINKYTKKLQETYGDGFNFELVEVESGFVNINN